MSNTIKSNFTESMPRTQNYFPNIWFDKVFEMKNENFQTVNVKTPNSLKTWKIYGISVHPTKGFTVAKSQPRITIESEIAVQIKAPEMVYENEIFKVDVKVINIYQNDVDVRINFEVQNGAFQNMTKTSDSWKTCYSFETLLDQNPNLRLDLKSLNNFKEESIYIKSEHSGKLIIKAIATLNGYNHEDKKIVEVLKPNLQLKSEHYFKVNWTIYDNGNDNLRIEIDTKVKSNQNITLEVEIPRGYIYRSHSNGDVCKSKVYIALKTKINFNFRRIR